MGKKQKKVGVISSAGIGDGLLMLIAAHRLFEQGYQPTLFQDSLSEMEAWFPYCRFVKQTDISSNLSILNNYRFLLLQYSNCPLAKRLIFESRIANALPPIVIFYPYYNPLRHPTLTKWDYIFCPKCTMAKNIAKAIASFLPNSRESIDNGITIPPQLIYQKERKRLLIHPTSTEEKRTWEKKKFFRLAKQLKRDGFQPYFCVSPKEHREWSQYLKDFFPLPIFPTLHEFAAFIYESRLLIGNESGAGHLASNVTIPTVIVANCCKQMTLWRPGWFTTKVLTPMRFIPNLKGWRIREKKWKSLISIRRVKKSCLQLL